MVCKYSSSNLYFITLTLIKLLKQYKDNFYIILMENEYDKLNNKIEWILVFTFSTWIMGMGFLLKHLNN